MLALAVETSCVCSVLIDFRGDEDEEEERKGIFSGEEGRFPIEVRKGMPEFLVGL